MIQIPLSILTPQNWLFWRPYPLLYTFFHPSIGGSLVIPRVLKNMVDLVKFLIFLMAFSIGLPGGRSMAMETENPQSPKVIHAEGDVVDTKKRVPL